MAGGPYSALDHEHLAHVVHYLMANADAGQKTQIQTLAAAAHADLQALEVHAREPRAARLRVLLRDVVDRAALEQARVAEMRIVDERSRRIDRLLVDLVAVLTPQQRAQLQSHVQAGAR